MTLWRSRCRRRTDDLQPMRVSVDRTRVGRRRLGGLIACCALLPMATACVTQGTYDEMTAERDDLESARAKLTRKLELLGAANTSLTNERDLLLNEFEDQRIAAGELERDVRRLTSTRKQLAANLEQTSRLLAHRESEIEAMRGTYDALVGDLQEEVTAGQIEIERLSSGLKVNLNQDVLFAKGSASVSAEGAGVLRKLGARLSHMKYQIEIIGHTDDVPIGRSYPSNWELAGARASSVVRLLASSGVDPARMSAVSRGEFAPIASNETAEGRASNRRIEIRLTPETTDDATETGTGAAPTTKRMPTPKPTPAQAAGSAPES
jgi:chemotaxis protein MotB